MSQFIDILCTKPLVGTDTRQLFTVNTAVADVVLDPGPAASDLLPQLLPNYKFQPKDNITILSMGFSLPYSFVLSTRIAFCTFIWNDGHGTGNFNVGFNNIIEIPFANYEMSLGAFVPWPTPRAFPYWITMTLGDSSYPDANQRTRISMPNTPAILNGAALPVTSFVKVLHNLPFVA